MSAVWDDQDDPDAPKPPDGGPPPADQVDPDPVPPAPAEGSILAQLHQEATDIATDEGIKTLRVGRHASLHAQYRMLDDDEIDRLQAEARRHHNLTKRVTRRRKGDTDMKVSNGENPEAERYFDALIIATACEQILFEHADGRLQPLHEIPELKAPAAVRYNRTLAKIARLDQAPEGEEPLIADITKATAVDVAIAMHTWTKSRSTSPLSSTAQILKIWMGAIDVQAMQEALGGN